jgi:hypothetical protein
MPKQQAVDETVDDGPKPKTYDPDDPIANPEWVRTIAPSTEPASFTHPKASTPPAISDDWASNYKAAHRRL